MSLKEWLTQFSEESPSQIPLDLYFLGDGIGESVLVNLVGQFVSVIDAYGGTEDSISRTLLNYLDIEKIDFLQVSHLHADHYSGFKAIVKDISVSAFGRPNVIKFQEVCKLASLLELKEIGGDDLPANSLVGFLSKMRELRDTVWSSNPNAYLTLGNASQILNSEFAGQKFSMDCVAPVARITESFLDALEKEIKKISDKGLKYLGASFLSKYDPAINRTSVINRVVYAESLVLLTGDTESSVIDCHSAASLKVAGANKNLIVKIPHHGSDTSDADLLFDENFLGPFATKVAVVCPFNSQGLPKPAVVQRYLDCGYRVFRTSSFSGPVQSGYTESVEPDGVVKIRIASSGELTVSTWGTAVQLT